MEEPPQCRYIWKQYRCGGRFQGQQVHHCSRHPIDQQCPNAVVDHYRDMEKDCRTCIAKDRARRRIAGLQRDIDTLRMAQPPDAAAIGKLEEAMAREMAEIRAWTMQGASVAGHSY
ncbi:hypothetical protein TWF481_003866 [Arthrobotrys musiformis]|uniref:C3H1-type domain-containing protein n=1 Tax=Arthrobotrys musiformis TaxID=47236 RepID=A0AAV9WHY4_9PEZI